MGPFVVSRIFQYGLKNDMKELLEDTAAGGEARVASASVAGGMGS